jgi:hypothetical protein
MDLDGYVLKYPGESLGYRRWTSNDDPTGLTAIVDAVDVFREGWEPLAAESLIDWPMDEAPRGGRLAKPHWLLSRTQIAPDVLVRSVMRDPICSSTESLSRSALELWLRAAIASSQAECEGRAELRQLRINTSRARVGPSDWMPEHSIIQLRTDAGTLRVPLERDSRGTWISGPREPAFDQPPLGLQVLQERGNLTLSVVLNYSFWLDPGQPAAAWLASALPRLGNLGWQPA